MSRVGFIYVLYTMSVGLLVFFLRRTTYGCLETPKECCKSSTYPIVLLIYSIIQSIATCTIDLQTIKLLKHDGLD